MSGDHNMNQTDSGWRKRQIALDKKAENARELGLDYEPDKTIIEMARDAGWGNLVSMPHINALEAFAKLVREGERKECAEHCLGIMRNAIKEAVQAEREACAKVCEAQDQYEHDDPSTANSMKLVCADAIRARGQA